MVPHLVALCRLATAIAGPGCRSCEAQRRGGTTATTRTIVLSVVGTNVGITGLALALAQALQAQRKRAPTEVRTRVRTGLSDHGV